MNLSVDILHQMYCVFGATASGAFGATAGCDRVVAMYPIESTVTVKRKGNTPATESGQSTPPPPMDEKISDVIIKQMNLAKKNLESIMQSKESLWGKSRMCFGWSEPCRLGRMGVEKTTVVGISLCKILRHRERGHTSGEGGRRDGMNEKTEWGDPCRRGGERTVAGDGEGVAALLSHGAGPGPSLEKAPSPTLGPWLGH